MAVDLSAPLITAMESQTRKPLLEIISSPKTDDIPFDGQDLSKSVLKDISDPHAIVLSVGDNAGRLIIVGVSDRYSGPPIEAHGIRFVYTDVDRLEFFQVSITTGGIWDPIYGVTCCELADGRIGVVWLEYDTDGHLYQYYLITSVEGVVEVSKTQIAKSAQPDDQWYSHPGLHKIADDNYMLVYARSIQTTSASANYDLVAGTPDTITNAANTFIDDGFKAGQTMRLQGTNPNCDGYYEIVSVDAGLITLATSGDLIDQTKNQFDRYSSNGYQFVKQVSADFLSWSSREELSGIGLDSLQKVSNPSFHEVGTDLWMFFDKLDSIGSQNEELWNCYYSISDDDGATWASPVQITSSTLYGDVSTHPVTMMRVSTTMEIAYTRAMSSLKMNSSSPGWSGEDRNNSISFDPVTRMLYVYSPWGLNTITKINIDTWEIVKQFSSSSTPAFPAWFDSAGFNAPAEVHDRSDLAVFNTNATDMVVFHFDGTNLGDELSSYYFSDWKTPTYPKNINTDEIPEIVVIIPRPYRITATQVDKANERIYVLLTVEWTVGTSLTFGYIDLTETIGIGTCSFHVIISDYRGLNQWEIGVLTGSGWAEGGMYVDPIGGYVVFSGSYFGHAGFCVLFDLGSGNYMNSWRHPDYGGDRLDFPINGITTPFIYNDNIYAGLAVYDVDDQPNLFGLVEIDIPTSTINTYRPTYCSDQNHQFGRPAYYKDDKIFFGHANPYGFAEGDSANYGIVAFDTVSKTWERWSNDNLPNLTVSGSDVGLWLPSVYDSTSGLIITSDVHNGVIAFNEQGYIKQSWYIHGELSGTWSWDDPAQLIQGFKNYDAYVVKEPDQPYMYAFWQSGDIGSDPDYLAGSDKAFLRWDKDGSIVDISKYVTNDEVKLSRTVSGNPSSISFMVSHGHLFDWNNVTSLLSIVLKKGRVLTIRWGERIDDTDHWSKAGKFFIHSINLAYKRGKYPVLRVQAGDQSVVWQLAHIPATTDFSTTPDQVLNTVLQTYGGVDAGDINLGTVEGETTIYKQWIDTDVGTIIEQICNRYSQFFRFDIEGRATFKYITNAADVDNVYSDSTKIFDFTPDDKYSDFTNRVVVEGLERTLTNVILPEERIEHLAGTLGWWGCKKEHTVWYSQDKTRGAIYPRMDVIETSDSIASYFQLGDKTYERLTEPGEAADFKYCTVEIVAEDLVDELIIAIAGAIVASFFPDITAWGQAVVVSPATHIGITVKPWWTISWGKIVQQIFMTAALLIIGSSTQYQIDVYAQPMGKVRRRVQANWNDEEHQIEIGVIIPRKIEDDLCYSAHDCQFVADHEGAVIQMQRNRVRFSRVADLRDEEGDTITTIHPYGLQVIKIYIIELHRKYKKASTADGMGYFTDDIVGWVIT